MNNGKNFLMKLIRVMFLALYVKVIEIGEIALILTFKKILQIAI